MSMEAPQLRLSAEHSQFYPTNLLRIGINGIARLEYWRRYAQPPARVISWRAQQMDFIRQRNKINLLSRLPSEEPFLSDLHEARRSYHFDQVRFLGDRALGLQGDTRFSRLRKAWLDSRISYHNGQAMQAAGKLLLPRSV